MEGGRGEGKEEGTEGRREGGRKGGKKEGQTSHFNVIIDSGNFFVLYWRSRVFYS